MFRRDHMAGLCLLAMVALAGCSQEGMLSGAIPVSGKVTFKGQPVAGATVSFAPTAADGRAASRLTNTSGVYKLTTLKAGDGALPGNYAVTIAKTAGTPDPAQANFLRISAFAREARAPTEAKELRATNREDLA